MGARWQRDGRPRGMLTACVASVVLASACSSAAPVAEPAVPVVTTTIRVEVPAIPLPVEALATLDRLAVIADEGAALIAIEAMRAHPNPRWVPYLVDILRIFQASAAGDAARGLLEDLTGLTDPPDLVASYVRFGSWMLAADIDPGSHYVGWKAAMYALLDPGFRPLIARLDDPRLAARLQWGGVGVGAIPALDDPLRVPAGHPDAAYLADDDVVFGVVVNGHAVAYPRRILDFHELSNDVVGEIPVAVANCTLCRSAIAFDRRVGAQTLTFLTSGLLLESNKVMVDTETETLWQQLTGEAIAGELAGSALRRLPLTLTTWADWRAEHPDTEVLALPDVDAPPGVIGGFEYVEDAAYADYYGGGSLWFPSRTASDAFDPQRLVTGLVVDGIPLAIDGAALADRGPTVIEVSDGISVVAVPTAAGGARVYRAGEPPSLAGGFDAAEEALALPDGSRLPRIGSTEAFWFAWSSLHPETLVWPEDG